MKTRDLGLFPFPGIQNCLIYPEELGNIYVVNSRERADAVVFGIFLYIGSAAIRRKLQSSFVGSESNVGFY